MAPRKKGDRPGNNKKKNKGPTKGNANAPVKSSAANSKKTLASLSNLITFHNKANTSVPSSKVPAGGYYEAYKEATTRFWHWMKQALPHSKMTAVTDLKHGVDQALQQNIAILQGTQDPPPIVAPPSILNDLTRSIKFRQLVTNTSFADTGGDEGHAYMLQVLRHCRRVLKAARMVARVIAAKEESYKENEKVDISDGNAMDTADAVGGRFHALALDDEDDEEEMEEEDDKQMEADISQGKFPTLEAPPSPEKEMDIEQALINGSDRFQAMALLHTMDDLMGAVDNHYGMLKNVLRGKEIMHSDGSKIQLLLECTVAANMATQAIQAAENELYLSHPHLSSIYHVLALVFLPKYIADIEKLVASDKIEEHPHTVLQLVAELVQCSFYNQGKSRVPAIVKRFAKKLYIRPKELQRHANAIHLLVSFEVQIAKEECMEQNQSLIEMFRSTAQLTPHSWLRDSPYIGGDRCILNTLCITQKVLDSVQDNKKLVGRPGFWGPNLDDYHVSAQSIRGDLDEAFAANILPELIAITRSAPFYLLPERPQLITVLNLLVDQTKNGHRTRPISIALMFGLHAILTSMFLLQGDGDLTRLSKYAKQSYKTLFDQLEDISDPSNPPENASVFYVNVNSFKQLFNFATPVPSTLGSGSVAVDAEKSEQLAFWNPLIGGEYLLYATYICSIGLGAATVDSLGQLRLVLHLYNALFQQKNKATIPFLKSMDKVFSNTKAVWPAGKPERGGFCKNFLIAWGMTAAAAAKQASEFSGAKPVFSSIVKESDLMRDLDEIFPEEYSASYRRLIKQDYDDDGAAADYTSNYTMKQSTKEAKASFNGLLELLTRVNMTRDAMDDDEDYVMPTNFPAIGCILLDFVRSFSAHMGWDVLLDKAMAEFPAFMRTGKTMGRKQVEARSFISSDLNTKQQGLAHMWAQFLSRLDTTQADEEVTKALDFVKDYFAKIQKDQYTFFIETEDQLVAARRSPHEGSYPHGRTGKTPHDPLRGFMHFKVSKRGTCVVRLIFPGKYTPLMTDLEDGDIMTPYKGCGSKLPRGANGKFRHIASYSMKELVQLGWDGATYCSSRGKHNALGHHVPFLAGYDSDSGDEYEPVDIAKGKRERVIGLQEEGLYMTIPDIDNEGEEQLVQIRNARPDN